MKKKTDSCVIDKKVFAKHKEDIKTQPIEQIKQNFNINDIRDSSYKLPRSKSGRKDHSLEKKKPIKYLRCKESTHINSKIDKNKQNTLENTISFVSVYNNLEQTQPKLCFDRSRNVNSQQKIINHLPICQQQVDSYKQNENFESPNLQLEQTVLQYIQNIWQTTSKIKLHSLFQQQMTAIQNIIKKIILKITHPKSQPQTNTNNLIHSFQNQIDNLISFRNSTTTNLTPLKDDNSQHSPDGGIELKKIMYILEDKQKQSNKNTKNHFYTQQKSVDTPTQNIKTAPTCDNHFLQDLTNLSTNTRFKQTKSQKNRPSRQNIPAFNNQDDHRDHNSSKDKIFLKNIVKKSKAAGMSLSGAINYKKTNFDNGQKKTTSEDLSSNSVKNIINDNQDKQISQESYQTMETETNKTNQNIQQKVQLNSQPKRIVLNQIIQMLNVKYNKSIKLQPRQI